MNREQVDLSYFAVHPEVCHPQAETLQRSIALETMNSRGMRGWKQYGKYFLGMWAYGLFEPERASVIRSAYFWFRYVDDVADGDKPLPPGYQNKQEFLQKRRELTQQVSHPDDNPIYGDREDILLVDYFSLAKRLRIDLTEESFAILDTIILDEERARNRRVLTQQELDDYFNKLDFACIGGALKVAGETCERESLSALSWAVRTTFDLRDFPRDLAQGIINISAEEIAQYEVGLSQVDDIETVEGMVRYTPIRRWYEDQVPRGLDFLQESRGILGQLQLGPLTNFALNTFFIRPVDNVLNRYAKMLQI